MQGAPLLLVNLDAELAAQVGVGGPLVSPAGHVLQELDREVAPSPAMAARRSVGRLQPGQPLGAGPFLFF